MWCCLYSDLQFASLIANEYVYAYTIRIHVFFSILSPTIHAGTDENVCAAHEPCPSRPNSTSPRQRQRKRNRNRTPPPPQRSGQDEKYEKLFSIYISRSLSLSPYDDDDAADDDDGGDGGSGIHN